MNSDSIQKGTFKSINSILESGQNDSVDLSTSTDKSVALIKIECKSNTTIIPPKFKISSDSINPQRPKQSRSIDRYRPSYYIPSGPFHTFRHSSRSDHRDNSPKRSHSPRPERKIERWREVYNPGADDSHWNTAREHYRDFRNYNADSQHFEELHSPENRQSSFKHRRVHTREAPYCYDFPREHTVSTSYDIRFTSSQTPHPYLYDNRVRSSGDRSERPPEAPRAMRGEWMRVSNNYQPPVAPRAMSGEYWRVKDGEIPIGPKKERRAWRRDWKVDEVPAAPRAERGQR